MSKFTENTLVFLLEMLDKDKNLKQVNPFCVCNKKCMYVT